MKAKQNPYIVIIVIITAVLLLNINTVLGQNSASSPTVAKTPTLQTTFEATKDTFVTGSNGNFNTNFGNAQSLTIGTSGTSPFIYGYHTLVDFDLSSLPPDAEIISATLRLDLYFNLANSPQSPNAEIIVYSEAITETWGEYSATWNNRPASASQGDPANAVNGSNVWEEWDVTNIVTAWSTGAVTQNGIKLFSTADSAIYTYPFYSREAGGNIPKLVVSYTTQTPTDTPTPSPTLPSSGACPGTVKVYATQDTYTNSSLPTHIYGDENHLALSSAYDRYAFFHFPVEQIIPPNQHIYSASIYLPKYSTPGGNPPTPWDVFVYTPLTNWDEHTINWLNQPGPFLGLIKEMTYHPLGSDYVIEDLVFFANLWHKGTYPNDGLGVTLQNNDTTVYFNSSEYTSILDRPYMQIVCGDDPPTPTPTPTNTPTPTATPTSAPKTINYTATDLEVTQGIQRITNSVRLVEGKRTFVRFYASVFDSAHVEGKPYRTDAKLHLYRGNSRVATLLPSNTNTGFLDLPYGWENPFLDQDNLFMVSDNTFIFEIPSYLTNGSLRMVGYVNLDWKTPETNLFDNDIEVTVDFEPVPQFGLRVYKIRWQDSDDTYYTTTNTNVDNALNFARQALPIPDIWAQLYTYRYDQDYGKGVPDLDTVNRYISQKYAWDKSSNSTLFQNHSTVRYYALLDKNDTKAGGLSHGIPARVASGWTRFSSTFTHELGHTFSRHHTRGPSECRAPTGCVTNIFGTFCPNGFETYPYSNGWIGPYQFSVEGFLYRQNGNFEIRSSEWKDIMSYCIPTRWMSDFTYHRIMDYISPNLNASAETSLENVSTVGTENLLVSGLIDMDSGALNLSPLFVIPDSTPLGDYATGEFAIVLRDSDNAEIARYWFTPGIPIPDGTCSLSETTEESRKMSFTELVPYNPLTTRVDIEGSNGTGMLGSLSSGQSSPAITVSSPNGGEIFTSDTVTVTWNASDSDGDDLYFNVQYSADNGTSWDMVAMNITDSQVVIDRENFRGSLQALIRVFASDGIHTSSDSSDTVFAIANAAPSVEITDPETDTFAILGQTVGLTAFAFDPDLGVIGGDYLTWYSDIDGKLGNGTQISTASLSIGTHRITVYVNDSDGAVSADSVQVTIYADASQIPTLPDKLKVGPLDIIIEPHNGKNTAFIQVYNSGNENPISWSATSSESWLELSSTNGTTPDFIYLDVNTTNLPEGFYSVIVTITNDANPTESYDVNVYLTVQYPSIYLPLITRD